MSKNKLIYAGHSAVFLEHNEVVVAIDPWLEGNPRCPKNLINPDKIDLIVLTHGHSDHAGDAVRLARQYGSHIAATFELAMILISQGVPKSQVMPMNKGGTVKFKSLSISLTHAFHSNSYDSSAGPIYAGEACGAVIRATDLSIYHAGDTAIFSDMALIRDAYRPNIVCLPIGDRFTMGPEEAALAFRILEADVAIPIHYKTFDLLTGTAEEFKIACEKLPETKGKVVLALEPGAEYPI